MEAQEIFDKVVTHLFIQGRKSKGDSYCLYRGPNGTKCAVGVLIPDELYDPDMEGNGIIELLDGNAYNFPSYFKENDSLLRELQHIHDTTKTTSNLKFKKNELRKNLKNLAEELEFNLVYNEPNKKVK